MNKSIKLYLSTHAQFSTQEFTEELRKENPNIARSTIFKILNALIHNNQINRISRGLFTSQNVNEYSYEPTNKLSSIASLIKSEFPLINFQVWELIQMNEFVNHQISRNTLFIDVEPMFEETIFNFLFEQYQNILFKPTLEEYYRYMGKDTIVINKLITEAPISYGHFNQATLEKILVDLFSHDISASLIEYAEYPDLFKTAFSTYTINQPRLFRYAKRRGIAQSIQNFFTENTIIL